MASPMKNSKLRRQIAFEAAQLMYRRQESEYYRAKQKAAKRICRGWVKPGDLPSNAEIRDMIQMFARTHEGELRTKHLLEMRLEALRMMQLLRAYRPRLIGSVLTGHVRQGSDIDLHVFSDSVSAVSATLEREGIIHDIERKQVRKHGEERVFTHIHIADRYPFELTIYAADQAHVVSKSSITGKPIERVSIRELEQLFEREYPGIDLDQSITDLAEQPDRFLIFESLLLPLENVKQHPRYHPEGDALFHSLQVFELARDALPYDEEFLLAALLHDVGKAIDPDDHVAAGLESLRGFVEDRTAWLIRFHMDAHRLRAGELGARAARRLRENESFEELLLLSECDQAGRVPGGPAPELNEALEYLRDLSRLVG